MPVFFIPSTAIQGKNITLSDPLYSHLSKSLRVRTGQKLRLRDEQRQEHTIIITKISKKFLTGEIQDTQAGPPHHKPTVTLAQSILKREHMAWAIQKATELGVSSIAPIITERVQRLSGKSSMNHYCERWERIALEAAQQSERWDTPHILHPQSFSNLLQNLSPTPLHFILIEREKSDNFSPFSFERHLTTTSNIVLSIGPEGGWSQEEVQEAGKAGCIKITLGERLLRSETAAVAGLVILQERLKQITFTASSECQNLLG